MVGCGTLCHADRAGNRTQAVIKQATVNGVGHDNDHSCRYDYSATAQIHDRRGNLIYDGRLVYRYDAFSRLYDVHEQPDATQLQFDEHGRITGGMGTLKDTFKYDALGRLILHEKGPATEHYYYDGVRRLQEVVEAPSYELFAPPIFTTQREFIVSVQLTPSMRRWLVTS